MPLAIRALSLESIVAKNPQGRGGTSRGELALQRLEHPATILRRAGKKGGPYQSKPKGPKPVTIRAEQEDN